VSAVGGPTVITLVGAHVLQVTGTAGLVQDYAGTVWNLRGASGVLRLDLGAIELVVGAMGLWADSLRWMDATVSAAMRRGPLEVHADVGARRGDLTDDPWGGARLTWQLLPSAALEVGAHRLPRDLTGFGAGTSLEVGVRLRGRPRSASTQPADYLRSPVLVTRLTGRAVRLRVPYHSARDSVSIAGPFSDWQPVPLERVGPGWWEVTLQLSPGVTEYVLVVQGRLVLPDGVAGVDDGFGGHIGLLFIP
jgi:hypothetical protein